MSARQRTSGVLAAALAVTLLGSPPAKAGGRWYAWIDRVSPGQAGAVTARWASRGVPVQQVRSERFYGVETGFVYLFASETLFQADAKAYIDRLQGGGFKGVGVQYFSDAIPQGVVDLLGFEPVFAVDANVDGTGVPEIVALTRSSEGDMLRILRRHVDDTLSVVASHPVHLFGVPKITEGERARTFPLGKPQGAGGSDGVAVVFEAAFDDPDQASHWSLVFAFRTPDLRVAPQVYFVPGARKPIATRVVFESTPAGLGYTVTVEGLRVGTRVRQMVWGGDRFIDAAAPAP